MSFSNPLRITLYKSILCWYLLELLLELSAILKIGEYIFMKISKLPSWVQVHLYIHLLDLSLFIELSLVISFAPIPSSCQLYQIPYYKSQSLVTMDHKTYI